MCFVGPYLRFACGHEYEHLLGIFAAMHLVVGVEDDPLWKVGPGIRMARYVHLFKGTRGHTVGEHMLQPQKPYDMNS